MTSWHRCSQFISEYLNMLRVYQLYQRSASYLHFCSRAWELEHNGSGSAFGFCMTSVIAIHLLISSLICWKVENLSTHSELSAFLFPSVCFCAFVWHRCSQLQFISHMLRIYQLRTSYLHFFFPSLRLDRLGRYYRRRCVTVFVLFVLIILI